MSEDLKLGEVRLIKTKGKEGQFRIGKSEILDWIEVLGMLETAKHIITQEHILFGEKGTSIEQQPEKEKN